VVEGRQYYSIANARVAYLSLDRRLQVPDGVFYWEEGASCDLCGKGSH